MESRTRQGHTPGLQRFWQRGGAGAQGGRGGPLAARAPHRVCDVRGLQMTHSSEVVGGRVPQEEGSMNPQSHPKTQGRCLPLWGAHLLTEVTPDAEDSGARLFCQQTLAHVRARRGGGRGHAGHEAGDRPRRCPSAGRPRGWRAENQEPAACHQGRPRHDVPVPHAAPATPAACQLKFQDVYMKLKETLRTPQAGGSRRRREPSRLPGHRPPAPQQPREDGASPRPGTRTCSQLKKQLKAK